MIDSPADFEAKTRAMFAKAKAQNRAIAVEWMINLVADVIALTPGEGNQQPSDTLYVPTGRLRGGYLLVDGPAPDAASKWHDGPYDLMGEATLAKITNQIRALPSLPATLNLYNDVGYADIVYQGGGQHRAVGMRPWVNQAAMMSATRLVEAQAKVMQGGDL